MSRIPNALPAQPPGGATSPAGALVGTTCSAWRFPRSQRSPDQRTTPGPERMRPLASRGAGALNSARAVTVASSPSADSARGRARQAGAKALWVSAFRPIHPEITPSVSTRFQLRQRTRSSIHSASATISTTTAASTASETTTDTGTDAWDFGVLRLPGRGQVSGLEGRPGLGGPGVTPGSVVIVCVPAGRAGNCPGSRRRGLEGIQP